MDNHNVNNLLEKYLSGECTAEERRLVESVYQSYLDKEDRLDIDLDGVKGEIWNRLPKQDKPVNIRKRLWKYTAAAASILFVLWTGYYIYGTRWGTSTDVPIVMQEIIPANGNTILKLSDGSERNLDELKPGDVIVDGGVNISRSMDGQLCYESVGTKDVAPPVWNYAITTTGGQQKLVLDDGTIVWLNADSELKFPTRFNGKQRTVELKGEAYFEVAHNSEKPFYVKSKQQLVQVLGTKFVISAYLEDPIVMTTLTQGKVAVTTEQSAEIIFLKPGEQTRLQNNKLTKHKVEPSDFINWTEGMLRFNEDDITQVMNKLKRVYNIDEVSYQGVKPTELFTGKFNKNRDIKQILRYLEKTEAVHFKVEGRRIIVMP